MLLSFDLTIKVHTPELQWHVLERKEVNILKYHD